MQTDRPELTSAGRQFAIENAPDSIVARVALTGYAHDWPFHHVKTAIEACNANAAS